MSDAAFRGAFDPSASVEDRRDEYSPMDILLMQTGLKAWPRQDAELRAEYGLKDGEWLDPEPNRKIPMTPLALDLGANDIENQIAFAQRTKPWPEGYVRRKP